MALPAQLLTKKMREASHAFAKRSRQLRRQDRRGFAKLITTGATFLDPARPPETPRADWLQALDEPTRREAVTPCAERQSLEERGEIDALRARYSGLRRYFPAFFAFPFHSEPGSGAIATGLDLVRQLDTGTLQPLPAHTPTAFVPGRFRAALHHSDATGDRRPWDLGLAVAVRDGLRSGDVSLPESRRHVSFANLIYHPTRWTQECDLASPALDLPQEARRLCLTSSTGMRCGGSAG